MNSFADACTTFLAEADAYNLCPNGEAFSVIEDRLFAKVGRPPRLDTMSDAATVLRHVIESDSIGDTFDVAMVLGVIAYLELETGR